MRVYTLTRLQPVKIGGIIYTEEIDKRFLLGRKVMPDEYSRSSKYQRLIQGT